MKKGEKVAQNYYNKHNLRIKDAHQHRLNNFNQTPINTYSHLSNQQHFDTNPSI
jgi:predicted solute-binding protein